MRAIVMALAMCGFCAADTTAQTPPAPEALVAQWFERWNALSDVPATHDALAALYAPDARLASSGLL